MAIEVVNRKRKYRVIVRVGRRKMSKSFLRRIDAKKWERRILNRRDEGLSEVPKPVAVTLNELRLRFEAEYSAQRHAPSTQVTEASLYLRHVAPKLGSAKLSEITRPVVEKYLHEVRSQRGATAGKVNRIRMLLNGMLNQAVRWELIAVNPVAAILPFRVGKPGMEKVFPYLAQSEVKQLLSWLRVHDVWLFPQVRTLVNTGIRYGEMLALRPEDIVPTATGANLMISRTYCHHTQQIRSRTKGGSSRVIPVGPGMAGFLLELGRAKSGGECLFRETWESCRHATKFRKHLDRAFKLAKVRRIRIHDLRHTFAVHFLERGGHLYDLQQLLGHSDSKLTERYAHFSAAMTERARGLVEHTGEPTLTLVDGAGR